MAPQDWRALQMELLAGERWIMDGNYGGTFDVRIARADTVIVLSLPRMRCLTRVLGRALQHRGQDHQANGCPERFDLTFLRWVWRYPLDSRPRLDTALARHRDHLQIIELTSPGEVRNFLEAADEGR